MMPDRIDSLIPQPNTQTQTNRQGNSTSEPRPAQPERAPASQDTDSVTLTDSAQRLSELSSEAAAGEAVDIGRVETVRQAIDEGTYQIDPQQIAERLLALDDAAGE